MIRSAVTSALEILGALSIAIGAGAIYVPAGLIVGGALAMAFGVLGAETPSAPEVEP